MSVEEHGTVDVLTVARDGEVLLTISDHLGWNAVGEHLFHLQEKINAYLSFVETGEIYTKCPQARSGQIVIDVVLKHAIPWEALWFFERASAVIEPSGIQLRHRVLRVRMH